MDSWFNMVSLLEVLGTLSNSFNDLSDFTSLLNMCSLDISSKWIKFLTGSWISPMWMDVFSSYGISCIIKHGLIFMYHFLVFNGLHKW